MANTSVPAAVAREEIVAQSQSEARRAIKWPVWQALPLSAIDVRGPAASSDGGVPKALHGWETAIRASSKSGASDPV